MARPRALPRPNGATPAAAWTRRLRILARGLNHEAHLSTQEAQASQDSRLPRPDAHPRRARRPAPPPAQGPQAPHSLNVAGADSGGRRRRRLSRSGDFQRVYREGSSRANRYLVLYRFPRAEDAEARTAPGWAFRSAARSAARSSATGSSGCCARPSGRRGPNCRPETTTWWSPGLRLQLWSRVRVRLARGAASSSS